MIDTHCHLVFGVDDGSYCASESLRMAEIAIKSGITDIIATPHCIPGMFENYAGEEYDLAFGRLIEVLHENKLDRRLRVHRGMEAFAGPSTLDDWDRGRLVHLAHSDYLLIECDFGEDPRVLQDILRQLKARGVKPIVAHPERYYFAHDNIKYLYDLADMGCALQLDTESILGGFGRDCRNAALELLGSSAAQLAASDAHDSHSRVPDMREAADYVANRFSPGYAELLFDTNPARILENKPLLFRGQERRQRRRSPEGFMSDEEYWGI